MEWSTIWQQTFGRLVSHGYLSNLVIGLAILLIGPLLGSIMQNKKMIIFGAALGLTIIIWIVACIAAIQTSEPSVPSITSAENNRRSNLLARLQTEYTLGRDNISPTMAAGLEMPPTAWLNRRLEELGETWQVTDPVKAP